MIPAGEIVTLEFSAEFPLDSTQSMTIISVEYSDTGFTYYGFTVEMDSTDVTSQFEIDSSTGASIINCSSISPVSGTLDIVISFEAGTVEGDYTFSWRYIYVAYMEPPDFPSTVDVEGETSATVSTVRTITASAGTGGSISPSGDVTVVHGDDQAFTITPDTGYHVDDVLVDGASVGAVSSYTFYYVDADHTIAASFALNTYTITASAGTGGSISPSGDVIATHGDDQSFTIIPNTGYHILDVLVDGASVGVVASYTFYSVDADHTIAASFALNQHELALYAGWNLIGISLTPQDPSVEGVFQGNLDKVDYIYGFDNEAKEYSYWFQGLPPQYQTLTQLECGHGYWIHVSEDFTVTLTGSLGEKAPLYTGWNLIGVNSLTPVSIEDFFAADLSTVASIHSYDDATKTYDPWFAGVGDPSDLLYPGEGYWVEIESP